MKNPLRGLLVAQFFGAFNDNVWKLVVALLAVKSVGIGESVGDFGAEFESAAQIQIIIPFIVFTVPLMIFSLPAAIIADRLSKRTIIIAMKTVEIVLMATGTVILLSGQSEGPLLLLILGLMGAQSAFFSPAKYGILPEILPHERLSAGNGIMELFTFVAIITGTAMGVVSLKILSAHLWAIGVLLTTLALLGFIYALSVPRVPRARSEGSISDTVTSAWNAIRRDRVLSLSVLGLILFWFTLNLLGQNILVYANIGLRLSEIKTGAILIVFAIGIGGGSVLAGKLSASKVEYGLPPLGTIALFLTIALLGGFKPQFLGTFVLVALSGVASGLIIVPLHALVQWRSPKDRKGAVIALSNFFVFGGMLASSLVLLGLYMVGVKSPNIFVVASLILLGCTLWGIRLLPDALLRLVLVLLTHTVYRLRVNGRSNVPEAGGALLVPNHVSFADGLYVLASLDRPVRFLVDSSYFHRRLLRPIMKSLQAIPISSSGTPREILTAFREAGKRLDEGELVCIFAEGQITRTGMLLPFRRGLEKIVKGRKAPIIPVNLDRVWGSIFSWSDGRALTKIPEQIPYPVTVSFGEPLPTETSFREVRNAVHSLSESAWSIRNPERPPLHHSLVRTVRSRPFHFGMADESYPRLSRIRALAGAIALARALKVQWQGQSYVGILLPSSVAAWFVNVAAALSGKISVNLNFTAGRSGMDSAAKQTQLQTIVTSRAFIEKAKIELPEGVTVIWVEDLRDSIPGSARIIALAMAFLAPIRLLERACGAERRLSQNDVATVIFSSGSTGEPKGVPLSHINIDSNVEAAAQVFRLEPADRIIGILPFFHSFGYMATIWLASNQGMGVVFLPNPIDGGAVGQKVQQYRITFLLATPTFLQIYLRRCAPAQFGSLRVVLAGAEKLSAKLAGAFEEYFGIRPLEGYGTTECSPVIAVSAPDFRAPGFYQPGSKRGSVGQPLPNVAVRIVDPDSLEPIDEGEPGMLLVKGPNVMGGYLGRDDLTEKVFHDGWYVTGDIARIDEDGFISITDRLSRFSKIGGEMVPHGRVEEVLQEAAGEQLQVFAVTAVPDERKGERLAVLHTLNEDSIPDILEKAGTAGLPNLFIPRKDQFVKVDQIPILGTGKLDLREVKRIANERLG